MKNPYYFLTIALASLFFAFGSFAAEMRQWSDTRGNPPITAKMVGLKDGRVLLRLENGNVVPVPLNILSAADRKYVQENAPVDTSAAAKTVDRMVLQKLKASYLDIKKDLETARTAKEKEDLTFLLKMTWPTEPTSDEQFVRRIYLDLAGRIPTYEETVEFLDDRNPDKRAQLIDQLLDSEAFVSHFFNYLSDLLRIRDGIAMDGINGLRAGAYIDWTKDQIRNNRPWDEWVSEMLSAQGFYWEEPATGYMLTDQGMPLCNLSNTFTVFAGTEITCAQCHDHPFEEIFQMDFYKLAAFFGGVDLRGGGDTPEARAAAAKKREYTAEWNRRYPDKRRFDNTLSSLLDSYSYKIEDAPTGSVKLPHDYKYDDAKPQQAVYPAAYFGELVDPADYSNPREAFAWWMTSKENPRFTVNMVNRLWKFAFGLAQIEPVYNIPGHLDGQAQNYELLRYLEDLFREMDYDIKGFLRVLFNSDTYQREANHHSPTLAQIDKGEYHFPAPILRRMTAEQIWDSMVALTTPTPEAASRRELEAYRELMRTDWTTVSFDEAMKLKDRFRNLGGIGMGMMSETMMASGGGNENKIDPFVIRAAERRLPDRVGSLLQKFGQSDKLTIEGSHKVGSIPQVMYFLNGDLTNKQMLRDSAHVVQVAKAAKNQEDGIERVFLSVLNRRPTSDEVDTAKNLVTGSDYNDLIWALLNTREFMFIQ